mmetsp:Transcript_42932/g.100838  ORF Transcript_42932/g.100838 Transcript_42932/m.100838 type:complete len:433 (-) Transcript_42932:75-1373(-)
MEIKNTFIDISGPKVAAFPTPLASAPARCAFSLKDSLARAAASLEDDADTMKSNTRSLLTVPGEGQAERRPRVKPDPLMYVPPVMEPIPEAKALRTPAAFVASIPPTPAAISSIPPTPAALSSMEFLATPTGTPAERGRTTLSLVDMIQPPVASSCSQPIVYQQPTYTTTTMSAMPVQMIAAPVPVAEPPAPLPPMSTAPAAIMPTMLSSAPPAAPCTTTQLLPPQQPPPPQYTPKMSTAPATMVPLAPPPSVAAVEVSSLPPPSYTFPGAPTPQPLSYNAPPAAPSAAVQLGLVTSLPAPAPASTSRVAVATMPNYVQSEAQPLSYGQPYLQSMAPQVSQAFAAPMPAPVPAAPPTATFQCPPTGSLTVVEAPTWQAPPTVSSSYTMPRSSLNPPPPPPSMPAPTLLLSPKATPAPLASPCAAAMMKVDLK